MHLDGVVLNYDECGIRAIGMDMNRTHDTATAVPAPPFNSVNPPIDSVPAFPVAGPLDSYYWSPARIIRNVWGILFNTPRQIEILRILRFPVYAKFIRSDPRFRFRYLI